MGSSKKPYSFISRRAVAGLLVVTAMALGLVLPRAHPGEARSYRISQYEGGPYSDDIFPVINNRGQFAWYHFGCQFTQPDGSTYTETGKYLFDDHGSLATINVPQTYYYPYNYFSPDLLLLNDSGLYCSPWD